MAKIKIGTVFYMPLNGKYAFGQYLYKHKMMGPIIQVFDYHKEDLEDLDIEVIIKSKILIPPIFTYLEGAIKEGDWGIVGYSEVKDFEFPNYLGYWSGDTQFEARMWFLWDGTNTKKLGDKLPAQYIDLEIRVIWPLHGVIERIKTGNNPYDKMKLQSLK